MGQAENEAPAGRSGGPEAESKATASGSQAQAIQLQAESATRATLPKLSEAPSEEREALFRRKMEACSQVFDFHNDSNACEKEAKRQILLEMDEYVKNTRFCFSEALMADVVSMVGSNIFRALPTRNVDPSAFSEPEDDKPSLEPAWPHLEIVYDFFLNCLLSKDVDRKIAKRFLDQNFMLKLLGLFDSEDHRERDCLKTILHRIYGRFMALRPFIRRAVKDIFFKLIYECETCNGVGELLDIFVCITNGFGLPLREEHKDFLIKALIPLYKVRSLVSFHLQLGYCVAAYLEKDPRLAYDIVTSMLRYWPVSTAARQVLLLNVLEDTLGLTRPSEFCLVQDALFRRLALCITCPHFQVAERTLLLWNNDHIAALVNQNRQKLFPIIIGALHKSSRQHWNSAVCGLTSNVLNLLMEADPQLFDECTAKHRADEKDEARRDHVRTHKWERLKNVHAIVKEV